MLDIDMLSHEQERRVRQACAWLFGRESAGEDSFLRGLSMESVKQAYRSQAKRYHPDHNGGAAPHEQKRREEQFHAVHRAFDLLTRVMESEALSNAATVRLPRTLIAIGGAKGGIGKSILTANLAVVLSMQGLRVAAVDLDLGGSNLHLYLGETFPRTNVNEYLQRHVNDLADIAIETRYGPALIGGGSSELGSANIPFQRKMKLMRALREFDADVMIIDLGGDTSYNMIDFFLSADRKIVVTTPDPASYLDAYNFIKVSLFRRLQRVYGQEFGLAAQKDSALHNLLQEATMDESGGRVKNIDQLRQRVKQRMIHHLPLINSVIEEFRLGLVVNRAGSSAAAMQIARRIQDVSRKTLDIDVEYLGNIVPSEKIEISARELVPAVARDPQGELAVSLRNLARLLLGNVQGRRL
ncbi:MAG: P-loop NTPase [Candidatus Cloacimonetes bacterium]|nr:P-loop NTPase [Candidatus Cloacimonadota bacterium]